MHKAKPIAITSPYNMLAGVVNPKLHSKPCDQLLIIIVVTFINFLENCGLLTELASLTQFSQCFLVYISSTISSLNKHKAARTAKLLFAVALTSFNASMFCSAIFANHTPVAKDVIIQSDCDYCTFLDWTNERAITVCFRGQ